MRLFNLIVLGLAFVVCSLVALFKSIKIVHTKVGSWQWVSITLFKKTVRFNVPHFCM